MASLSSIYEFYKINKNSYGRKLINNINIVSGGYIGAYGDLVVDNINRPSKIIGMADGKGKVIYDYPIDIKTKVNQLENIINNNILNTQNY
jgi:outer membrane lipoprotein-sorting protein